MGKRETKLRNLQEFCRNQNKVISILTETHINHDQIHYIRNNWLDPIFFSPGTVAEEDCLSCFMQSITEVDTDPSEMFVSFTVTLPNERLLCVYASKGIAPGNKWLGGVSMKDYKIIWK